MSTRLLARQILEVHKDQLTPDAKSVLEAIAEMDKVEKDLLEELTFYLARFKHILPSSAVLEIMRHLAVSKPIELLTPVHYQSSVQPVDAMKAWMTPEAYEGFLLGNVIKYIARYRSKDGTKDLIKARDYLNRMIDLEKTCQP